MGWLEELSKLENMRAAAGAPHLQTSKSWPVKFRLINKDKVLPGQTLLFMDDKVLHGNKLQAYVILKILRYCTSSSARNYQCKYAVQQVFTNKSIDSIEEVGATIKEIFQYGTIRGKFPSVHPDLAAEGITRVEVGEEGLHFIKNLEPGPIYNDQFVLHVGFTLIFSDDAEKEMLCTLPSIKNDEDEMERRALAMSLKQEEGDGIKSELQRNAKSEM